MGSVNGYWFVAIWEHRSFEIQMADCIIPFTRACDRNTGGGGNPINPMLGNPINDRGGEPYLHTFILDV